MAIQSDGKIVMGGNFSTHSTRFVRVNATGTGNSTFNVGGTGFNGQTTSIKSTSDGGLIVTGYASTYIGTSLKSNGFIKLTANGAIDTSFISNMGTGGNNSITGTDVQADGKILISGYFKTFSGATRNTFVRQNVNGAVNTSLNLGTGASGLDGIKSFSNGKIILYGSFMSVNNKIYGYMVQIK